ncbi:histidine kinase [Haloferula sp. BvORR071]|uniref:histidine kinase n=1 Tax=Haloferula sp. BvORR071 TaxID=1396141 RepID=UPI00055184C9|nr:histidine kinase [Haloferula sp. BvORR071]
MIARLLLLILLGTAMHVAAQSPSAAPKARTVRELQNEATAEAFTGADVVIEAVVTWADPSAGKYFYMQDASAGMKVIYQGDIDPAVGDKVRVTGRLSRGPFAPVIENASFESLGKGVLPGCANASGGGLLNGSFNGERVDVDGWIRTAEFVDGNDLVVVVDSGACRISFRISNTTGLDPAKLIAYKIRVLGVAASLRARKATNQLVDVQILVASQKDIQFGEREKQSPWDRPPTPLREVFRYHPGQTRADRLQVTGTVLHVADEIAWLHDGDAGLALRGADVARLHRGDRISAVGFRDMLDSLPVLSDVIVRKSDTPGTPPKAKEVPAWQLGDGLHHADLVAVSGLLLDRIQTSLEGGGQHTVLALQSPRGVFTAQLDSTAGATWETGSTLRVSGVCAVQTDSAGDPKSFKILVPDDASITVLKAAPFFTVRRMLILLCIILGVLLAVTATAFLLARRNTRLRTEVRERQAVAAERGRLARDLHDTLEQGLTGLQLQIRGLSLSLGNGASDAPDRMEAMRGLVRQCRTELRQSIWDLRADSQENFDLGEALQRMAQSLFLGAATRAEFHQQRSRTEIPGLIADNLLRIGQEAMTNVLKHAEAGLIRIELVTTPESVTLSVSDNGQGIANQDSATVKAGHFGIAGMEERAARMGAQLSIEERNGGGTVVKVQVPLPAEAKTRS